MSNYKNFLSHNQDKLENFNSKNKLLIVDRGRLHQIFHASIFALAFNKKKKMDAILLLDNSTDKSLAKIYQGFGIYINLKVIDQNFILKNIGIFFKLIFYFFLNIFKIKFKGFEWFVKNFKIENVYIGDLIYDTYIRHNHSFKKPKIDMKFIKLLFFSILRVLRIKKIIKKNNVSHILVQSNNYSYNSGVAVRVGIERKLKVFFQEENHLTECDENTTKRGKFFLRNNIFYRKKIYKKISQKNADKFFTKRMKGKSKLVHTNTFDGIGVKTKDILYSNRHKKLYSKSSLLKKIKVFKNYENIILIGAHAYSDAPHSMGSDFVFMDYYSKMKETLDFIYRNDEKNLWIIKPHPMQNYYGEKKINDHLFNSYKKHNIKICPKNINTSNLLNIIDIVISGRGTILIEALCFGKKSVALGSNPYSGPNLFIECKSKDQYFKLLKNLKRLKKITSDVSYFAKKKLYYIENYQPIFSPSSLIPKRNKYFKSKK